jgi:hypothetical protein
MTVRRKRRAEIARRVAELEKMRLGRKDYSRDPVAYVADVLHARLTPIQEAASCALLEPPYRVAVKSGHGIGKSFWTAAMINWWYDTFDPGVVISTAPTWQGVKDVLWTEVRIQRLGAGLGGFRGEMLPYLYSAPDHWAQGITANPASMGAAFAGRHRERMLFAVDEAVGVKGVFFNVIDSMFLPDGTHALIMIYNPVDATSKIYEEETATDLDGRPKYRVFQMSSLDHPNIAAELRGLPKPIPQAVGLRQVETGVADECDPVQPGDEDDRDFLWPPAEFLKPGQTQTRYRPGPIFQSRWLGEWPDESVYGVWSDHRWKLACAPQAPWGDLTTLPSIGCDVAVHGDDDTAIAHRHGRTARGFERHNGWDEVRAAWLSALRHEKGGGPVDPKLVPINVDDVGVGNAVVTLLRRNGYFVRDCTAQARTAFPDRYASLRDELWFTTVEKARKGLVDLSRLGTRTLAELKNEAMTPLWAPTASGARRVEAKREMKKRLGRSPDGMDALNLAYYESPLDAPTVLESENYALGERPSDQSGIRRRGWMD